MNHFEVRYHDSTMPSMTFMVVVPAKDIPSAYELVTSMGYQPIQVNQLIGSK